MSRFCYLSCNLAMMCCSLMICWLVCSARHPNYPAQTHRQPLLSTLHCCQMADFSANKRNKGRFLNPMAEENKWAEIDWFCETAAMYIGWLRLNCLCIIGQNFVILFMKAEEKMTKRNIHFTWPICLPILKWEVKISIKYTKLQYELQCLRNLQIGRNWIKLAV